MKMLMVELGYKKYVGSEADILKLLSIAMRLHHVERSGYSEAYTLSADPEPFVSEAQIAEVSLTALPAHAADVAYSALRGILALEDDVGLPKSAAGRVAANALLRIAGARMGVKDAPGEVEEAAEPAADLIPF